MGRISYCFSLNLSEKGKKFDFFHKFFFLSFLSLRSKTIVSYTRSEETEKLKRKTKRLLFAKKWILIKSTNFKAEELFISN